MDETSSLEVYADSFRAAMAARGARMPASDDEIRRYHNRAIDATLGAHHLMVERALKPLT